MGVIHTERLAVDDYNTPSFHVIDSQAHSISYRSLSGYRIASKGISGLQGTPRSVQMGSDPSLYRLIPNSRGSQGDSKGVPALVRIVWSQMQGVPRSFQGGSGHSEYRLIPNAGGPKEIPRGFRPQWIAFDPQFQGHKEISRGLRSQWISFGPQCQGFQGVSYGVSALVGIGWSAMLRGPQEFQRGFRPSGYRLVPNSRGSQESFNGVPALMLSVGPQCQLVSLLNTPSIYH